MSLSGFLYFILKQVILCFVHSYCYCIISFSHKPSSPFFILFFINKISHNFSTGKLAGVPMGRHPMASLGTAQRLAPVHSGLPLCETCLSSAATAKTSSMILPAASSRIKAADDGGFVVWGKTVEEIRITPLCRVFQLSGTGFSHTSPVRSTGQSYVVSGTFLLSSQPIQPFLLHCSLSRIISSIVPSISATLHLNHFLFLLQNIKIAVINISQIFSSKNVTTADLFFCYSLFTKLFCTAN